MDLNQIEKLAEIMKANGITLAEISEGQVSIKLERGTAPVAMPIYATPVAEQPAFGHQISGAPGAELRPDVGALVKSPTVGVFYASSSPDGAPFVSIGTAVKVGDVLCIIEAMKLMNEITADSDGEIAEIMVGNGQVVEFGQPLFRIK